MGDGTAARTDAAGAVPVSSGAGASSGGTDHAEAGASGTTGTESAGRRGPGTAATVVTSVITGLVAGAVATVMHGSIWYFQTWWLPWGLVFSGALLFLACLWCGTSTLRVWAAAVPGLIAYVIAWAGAYLRNGSALVVTTWSAPIGMVGLLWFAVIFVAVMAAVIVTGRWLRRSRAR